MKMLYFDYVFRLSRRHPCLQKLCQFLTDNPSRRCHIACLEFSSDGPPIQSDIEPSNLRTWIEHVTNGIGGISSQLLFVEDLTKDVIEILGSTLDLDPMFFAYHIDNAESKTTSMKPSATILPSKIKSQSFLNLHYHNALEFYCDPGVSKRFLSDSNVPRRVRLLPPTAKGQLALRRQCCSAILMETKSGSWIGRETAEIVYGN
jgi:hypothetical protein